MKVSNSIGQLLATVALATVFSTSPYVPSFDFSTGFKMEPSFAFAKSGKGKGGNENDDDHEDDDHDNSGSGNSGSGNSGSGNSGSDDSGSDDHGSDDHGGDDSGSDDSGSDDSRDSDSGRSSGSSGNSSRSEGSSGSVRVSKIETNANGVEVRYSNGTKEEIENGRYQRKNAQNRTIEERPATGADVTRLRSLANSVSINSVRSAAGAGTSGRPTKVERQGNNIGVRYSNGWKEEIESGRYELKDPYNRTVVQRAATSADLQRLRAITN